MFEQKFIKFSDFRQKRFFPDRMFAGINFYLIQIGCCPVPAQREYLFFAPMIIYGKSVDKSAPPVEVDGTGDIGFSSSVPLS